MNNVIAIKITINFQHNEFKVIVCYNPYNGKVIWKWRLWILVCLFVCGFSSHSRIVHSFGDVTITGEKLLLIHAHHLWPLSSEGSLACHTYCNTVHPFKMVISEDPWHSHLLPHPIAFGIGDVTTYFNDSGFEHPTFRLRGERSNRFCLPRS